MVKFCLRRRTVMIGVAAAAVIFLISHVYLKGEPASASHGRDAQESKLRLAEDQYRHSVLQQSPFPQHKQQHLQQHSQRQHQQLHHHPPLHLPNGTTAILRVAREIHRVGDPVLMTIINDAYLPFTFSWLCNTHYMDVHWQTIIVTTDLTSRRRLHHYWPDVHVVGLAMGDDYSGNQRYQHAGYVRLMVRRAEMALAVLEEGIELLLFEVDCVWLSNPLQLMRESAQGFDMVVTAISNRPGLVAGGFLYIRPTLASRRLWHRLVEHLVGLEESILGRQGSDWVKEEVNDQVFLTRLMRKGFAGIRYKQLPFDQFADGKWYKMPAEGRAMSKPFIINNNWVVGNRAKKKRAQRFGHWFLKDSLHCDFERVNKTVYH